MLITDHKFNVQVIAQIAHSHFNSKFNSLLQEHIHIIMHKSMQFKVQGITPRVNAFNSKFNSLLQEHIIIMHKSMQFKVQGIAPRANAFNSKFKSLLQEHTGISTNQ
jgi:hypothetical protein